jgi:putative FmdB family regulatory protein
LPLYEYQCATHGRFEIIQKFSDEPLKVCPTCGQPVQKLLSAPAIQFKGTGWYVTDYARKGSSGDSGSKDSGKSESKAEGSKAKDSSGDTSKS